MPPPKVGCWMDAGNVDDKDENVLLNSVTVCYDVCGLREKNQKCAEGVLFCTLVCTVRASTIGYVVSTVRTIQTANDDDGGLIFSSGSIFWKNNCMKR